MSVLKPRTRLVYFRVSEEEFQQFNRICESIGARSLSDLARSAMQNMMTEGTRQPNSLHTRLTALEAAIDRMNTKLSHLLPHQGETETLRTAVEETTELTPNG